MQDFSTVDGLLTAGLFLYTGTDILGTEGSFFDLLSKFGVVAVLWYWLLDTKKMMKDQTKAFEERLQTVIKAFEKESLDTRQDYEKLIEQLKENSEQQSKLLLDLLSENREELKEMKNKLFK